jgi:PPOX class probable F420-dependent enzyme
MSDPTPSRLLRGSAVLRDSLVRELLDARLVAVLATFDPERGLHAVPVWYAAVSDGVVLATGSQSRKVRNLQREPRAALVVHDSRPGFEVCGVSLAGTVEIVRGAAARPLIDAVHKRYVLGAAQSDPAVADYLDSDDVALRFVPESALTADERSSAAAHRLRLVGGALPLVPTTPRS